MKDVNTTIDEQNNSIDDNNDGAYRAEQLLVNDQNHNLASAIS